MSQKQGSALVELLVSQIQPDPDQHRKHFDEQKLQELAASIKQHGLIEPIVVRPIRGREGCYRIIAGERRWRACNIAGVRKVPCRILKASDNKAFEIGVIENVQRENVNAMEEAFAYKRLMEDNDWDAAQVGAAVGKATMYVDMRVALCELHPNIQALVKSSTLSVKDGYEIVRAGRMLAEKQGVGVYETQFSVLKALQSGTKIKEIMVGITRQANLQERMFEVEEVSEEVKQARATMEDVIGRLERLCAKTWNEKTCALVVSAFNGNLDSIIDKLVLLEKHIGKMRRDLKGERARQRLAENMQEAAA